MNKFMKHFAICFIVEIVSFSAFAAPVDEATALTAAERFLQTSRMAARSLPDRTAESIRPRGNLWVVELSPSGHILVSGSDHATPIVGFSENDFSEGEENSPERAMLDAADAAVAAAESGETKERHSRWDSLLAEFAAAARKAAKAPSVKSVGDVYIEPFVDSKYNQNQPWNDLTPVTSKDSDYIWRGRSCAGCVSIADAAIFRELRWPVYPARTETITHNLRGENFAIRFDGSAPFDWDKMYDTYNYSGDMRGKSGAEEDKRYEIGRYVLWLNQSASMSYNVGESTSTKYTAAHGAERDWYTIGQSMSASDEAVEEKVTGILAAGIPVFVGIGGHAVVADGWQKEDSNSQVHLVYGYGGNASDKWYSLETGPAQYFWVDHYPRAKPQLDPIPRVVGNSVTLSWHFPDCYTNSLYMFYVKGKRRTSNAVVDWTADFSNAATGNAYPANIWYATNNFGAASTALDAEDLTYGFYQFSTPLTVTASSELSFKIRGGAHKSGDACKDNVVIEICGEDGNWHELFVPEINWAYWPGTWKANTNSLAAYAGQTVQLRIYKRHATYNGHVAIGDFKVTNVIPLTGEDVFRMVAATERSATIAGLVDGSDYYFSVTPYTYGALADGEPSDAKITICHNGASSEMPASFASIQYAANGGTTSDLVDGYLADGPIGRSMLHVATPTTVTNLTATPSHVELVKDENVHVTKVSDGNWNVTFDPVIPANRDRQRIILTLHATDTNGTTAHRDVLMRMTEDKIVVGEGETWTLNEPYELTRSLVMAGGTVSANEMFAINQNSISSFTVVSNSTLTGTGKLCISNSNATITFENSKSLTNSLNIESANQETLTLDGTGTFVQGAGTTIKVYDMSLASGALLKLQLSDAPSTTDAIVQLGYATPAISGWKLMIAAPQDLAKGTYPLISAPSYLEKPANIYLPGLYRECTVVVKNYNTLCLVVGDPETDPVYDGPAPIAEWNKDFRRTVDGCSLDRHGNAIGADGTITINTTTGNDYQGVDVNLTSGTNAITVIVKYSNLAYSTANGRMVFTSCAELTKTTDRTAVRLTTGNELSGSWGNNSGVAENGTSSYLGTSVPASSGYMVFCYGNPDDANNRGTLLCSGASEGSLNVTNFWHDALKFAVDCNNKTIYGATIGGYRKYSTNNGWKNATGMKIEAIAVFGARLTEAERNAYRFPKPAEKSTATDFPVPYSWFSVYYPGIETYPDAMIETFAKMDAANNENKLWECYVLGLDPTNTNDRFTATIRMEGQNPMVEFSPTNTALGNINYVLQGKPTLTNEWGDCVSFEDPGDTNRFFRVKVKW